MGDFFNTFYKYKIQNQSELLAEIKRKKKKRQLKLHTVKSLHDVTTGGKQKDMYTQWELKIWIMSSINIQTEDTHVYDRDSQKYTMYIETKFMSEMVTLTRTKKGKGCHNAALFSNHALKRKLNKAFFSLKNI